MSRLFGVPIDSLALMLVGGLAAALTALAVLAARNRVFLRLGVRNLRRRRARAVLIVAGLMLGTAIMTAALATGDTMSRTIRTLAISALGRTDEVVAAKGIGAAFATQSVATGTRYFPLGYADRIARAAAGSGLVAAVEPAIVEPVAVQDVTSRQNEPRVTLFASEPARMRGFGEIRAGDTTVSLADLRPGEIFLNAKGAEKLDAKPGDVLRIFAGRGSTTARVRAVVHYRGAAAVDSGVMMQLDAAQKLLGKPGQIGAVFVANRGGVARSAAVTALLEPTVSPLGLEVDQTKHDLLRTADAAGASFMSLFTTFGSFSIAAGILLIFLIFVMLAAERRGELGIARAVGTRRGHLVQMFLFEGVAYDLAAAVVGALAGVLVAYGMVLAMAHAFAATSTIHISYSVSAASIAVGYSLGVLLTLVVVAFSAWRVSRMNIVSAIRNLGDPPVEKARRRRWLVGLGGIVVGAVLAAGGVHAKDGIVLGLGVALLLLSLVPLLRTAGAPERAVHTGAGLALILWFLPLTTAVAAIAWVTSGDPVRALAVFVVATPCPLILAAPIALLSGVSRAARAGIVVKGAGVIERLGSARTVLLDKTGTLTLGSPHVERIATLDGIGEAETLRLAASLDQLSLHPLAVALVGEAHERRLPLELPTAVAEEPGRGIEGAVGEHRVAVGSGAFLRERGYDGVEARGRALVGADGRLVGAISFADPPRDDALGMVERLHASGIRRVAMLTGDRAAAAEAIGAVLHVDQIYAEQSPEEKLAVVRAIAATPGLAPVVMVGDGINDAPALALADVGIAMGSAGATASSETADAIVLVERVDRVVDAIRIGRRSLSIARQSVLAGIGLSLAAMAFAALGFIPPLGGALLQEGIDVAVIVNALRAL